MIRKDKSRKLFQEAKNYIPGGVNSPVRAFKAVGGDPLFIKSAKGAYLYDEDQSVARAYKAACTPDFFLFDADLRLVYRGELDDSRPGNGKPVTGAALRAGGLHHVLDERAADGLDLDDHLLAGPDGLARRRRAHCDRPRRSRAGP